MARQVGRHGTTVILLLAVLAFMGGLTAAAVPLYRIFCSATGYGGTTERASAAPADISAGVVTVRFNTEIDAGLDWEFRPLVDEVQVHPGEQKQVFFRAKNLSSHGITARAVYNVTPTKAGIYFDKLQCFCFNAQYLAPGESKDMGVVFFVDPDLLKDPSTNDVRTITLSYAMFKAADQQSDRPKTEKTGPNS
ncbi:MAG TPA: cytochrome c oxidase assembly protein [Stellaceae bacterium]|nr:cytochrome c oxidase assembly protein [Stellaceae bacterium]